MKELTLYEITNAFPALMENEEIDEEQKQNIEKELTTLLQRKSSNIIGYTKNVELTIEAMKTEEKRLSEQRKALEKRLDNFKKYIKECMDQNGITKVSTDLGTLSIRKNPISIDIKDENLIPDEYKTVITTTKIDKKAITENFKTTGEIIEGVTINTNNTSLSIK